MAGRIRIPIGGKCKNDLTSGLIACVEHAAERSGMNSHKVAVIMTYFIEELVEQVAQNKIVNIPGFGMFCPAPHAAKYEGGQNKVYPGFSASMAFRREVNLRVPFENAPGYYVRHRKSNHITNRSGRKSSSNVRHSLAQFRERLLKQAGTDCVLDGAA